MIWKRYQNELILSLALLLLIVSYIFKNNRADRIDTVKVELSTTALQANEIIALKKQWSDSTLKSRVLKLKESIAPSKIKQFSIKAKKLSASFQNLNAKEINKIITKLENTAVQITKLELIKDNKEYKMEIKCKW